MTLQDKQRQLAGRAEGNFTPGHFVKEGRNIAENAAFQAERERLAGARQRGKTADSCCGGGLILTEALHMGPGLQRAERLAVVDRCPVSASARWAKDRLADRLVSTYEARIRHLWGCVHQHILSAKKDPMNVWKFILMCGTFIHTFYKLGKPLKNR